MRQESAAIQLEAATPNIDSEKEETHGETITNDLAVSVARKTYMVEGDFSESTHAKR